MTIAVDLGRKTNKTNKQTKEAAEARPSLHMSKCHIVGNLMHWLNSKDDLFNVKELIKKVK